MHEIQISTPALRAVYSVGHKHYEFVRNLDGKVAQRLGISEALLGK